MIYYAACCVVVTLAIVHQGDCNYEEVQRRIGRAKISDGLSIISNLYPDRNIIMSPFSLSASLQILQRASTSRTSRELRDMLETKHICPNKHLRFELDHGISLGGLFQHSGRMYISHKPNRSFVDEMQSKFNIGVKYYDFKTNRDAIAKDVVKWAHSVSAGHLGTRLFKSKYFKKSGLVLYDAVKFEGVWKTPFTSSDETMEFTNIDGTVSHVSPMSVTGRFKTGNLHEIDASVIQLPFHGDTVSLIIIVPRLRSSETMEDFQDTMCSYSVENLLQIISEKTVEVTMPRFIMSQKMNLKDILQLQNYSSVIGPHSAYAVGGRNQQSHLNALVHQVEITVDAKGASMITQDSFSSNNVQEQENTHAGARGIFGRTSFDFIVDAPFLFYLYDADTRFVPVVGRIIRM